MTFSDDVSSGDERRALEAMRDKLAAHFEVADTNVIAQVAARLQAVITRLAEIGPAVAEVSASDDIGRRREARRAAAGMVETPAGSSVKRGRRSS